MWFEKARKDEGHLYAPLDPTTEDVPQSPPRTAARRSSIYIAVATLTVAIVAFVSFFAGASFGRHQGQRHPNLPIIRKTLEAEHAFMGPPDSPDDHTWDPMFPSTTFFPHPDIAPERGTLSVFHQLHCLMAIRRTYWAAVDPIHHKQAGKDKGPGDPAYDKWHMNHCIELIRQSLMCNADLTLEPTNKTLGGVTGFGTEHNCVDWDSLVKWVDDAEENAVDHKVKTHP